VEHYLFPFGFTGHWPLFSPIMRLPSYRQRLYVEYYLGESSGSASMPRAELSKSGLNDSDRSFSAILERVGSATGDVSILASPSEGHF
jgi:hypothetical protein